METSKESVKFYLEKGVSEFLCKFFAKSYKPSVFMNAYEKILTLPLSYTKKPNNLLFLAVDLFIISFWIVKMKLFFD